MKKHNIKTTKIMILISLILVGISCEKIDTQVPKLECSKGISKHPNAANYQKIVDKLLQLGVPGVSITVISPEGTWSSTGGKADLANNVKLTPCHILRVGSVSKIFTATTIMKLQEEGKLSIDDKINKYIPSSISNNIANGNEATIKQLLRHQSGIPEYSNIDNITKIMNLSIKKQSAEENIRSIFNKKADFKVGTNQNYSNTNYLLLGMIIKNISGKAANEVVKEKILMPLNLENIYMSNEIPAALSRGYNDINDNGLMTDRTEMDNNAVGGEDMLDGGVMANSYDLAKFFKALISGQILSSKSFNQMQEFIPITQDLGENLMHLKEYGLGLMKIKTDHGIAVGHYGTVYCFNAMVYYFPEQQVTIAIIRNGNSSKIKKFFESKEIFNFLFE
jgi:D-alanyl-D-alanine carboxypeptidase